MDYEYFFDEKKLKEMTIEQLLLEYADVHYEFLQSFKYSKESLDKAMKKIEFECVFREMKMDFYKYQDLSTRTLNTGINKILNASNLAMGLAGEAGETVDYLKKIYYHGHELSKEKLRDELGDVLWYISSLAYIHDIDLSDVAQYNVEKLKKRYPDGFTEKDSVQRKDVK